MEIELASHLPEGGEAQRPGDERIGNGEGDARRASIVLQVLHLHSQEARSADAPASVSRHERRVDEKEESEQEQGVDDGLKRSSDRLFHVGLRLREGNEGGPKKV